MKKDKVYEKVAGLTNSSDMIVKDQVISCIAVLESLCTLQKYFQLALRSWGAIPFVLCKIQW